MTTTRRTRTSDVRGLRTLSAQMRVRQLILDGELRVGQRVPELNLVQLTGVSRTPVRAALVRLAEEGLLEYVPSSGGFIVRAFDESEVSDAIDVRGTLEGAAARRAAERRPSSSELNDLRDCVGAMDSLIARPTLAIEHYSDYGRLNERFHELLVALAQSPALTRSIERILSLPFASPSAFVLAQADMPNARESLIIGHDQHRGILDAIAAGEGTRAEHLAREHSNIAQRDFRSVAHRKEWLKQVAGGNLIHMRKSV